MFTPKKAVVKKMLCVWELVFPQKKILVHIRGRGGVEGGYHTHLAPPQQQAKIQNFTKIKKVHETGRHGSKFTFDRCILHRFSRLRSWWCQSGQKTKWLAKCRKNNAGQNANTKYGWAKCRKKMRGPNAEKIWFGQCRKTIKPKGAARSAAPLGLIFSASANGWSLMVLNGP